MPVLEGNLASKNEPVWRFVLLVFVVHKILVLLPAWLAIRHKLPPHDLWWAVQMLGVETFYKWDSGWYGRIAAHGYDPKASAFFPLFPLLMSAVHQVLSVSVQTAGVLVSHLAFLCMLYVLYKLLRLDYQAGDARNVLWLVALYPTAYYFSAAYTESLFLLLLALTLYAVRRGRWASAGVSGFFASVTRNTGVFLTIPFVLEYFSITRWRDFGSVLQKIRETLQQRGLGRVLWLLLIPLSFFLYMAYLQMRFHDPLAFSHAQAQYGRSFLNPITTLVRGYALLGKWLLHSSLGWYWLYFFLEFSTVTLTLLILLSGLRTLRVSYWVLLLYAFVIPMCAPAHGVVQDYFVSYSRYSLVIFPLYVGLYELLKHNRILYHCTQAVFALLLVVYTYAWSTGQWVA